MADIDYKRVINFLVCPGCRCDLEFLNMEVRCKSCENKYSLVDGILSFLPEEETQYWQERHLETIKNTTDEARQVGYFSKGNYWLVNNMVKRLLGNRTGYTILDVGCGHGLMSHWLTKENTVLGVDFTLEMLKAAEARGLTPLHADGLKLPIKKSSIDVIMSIEVIQCFDDEIGFMHYLSQFLRPDGVMLISGLSSHSIQRRIFRKIYNTIKPKILPKLNDPVKLATTLEETGFEVEVSYTCFPFNKIIVGKVGEFKKYSLGATFFILAKKNRLN